MRRSLTDSAKPTVDLPDLLGHIKGQVGTCLLWPTQRVRADPLQGALIKCRARNRTVRVGEKAFSKRAANRRHPLSSASYYT
ncbi:hypothetical protein GCM10012278_63160 [Nonomuraea glycinis]|uniref:Uncharacterized protein n=1 Tax=Nonomuraea glycinis TaxID=2047744 RepID=A0A918E9B3_9ACTN|nr:hypothetical protein GCM10012278_63160 [Nonomuraea glycinis]